MKVFSHIGHGFGLGAESLSLAMRYLQAIIYPLLAILVNLGIPVALHFFASYGSGQPFGMPELQKLNLQSAVALITTTPALQYTLHYIFTFISSFFELFFALCLTYYAFGIIRSLQPSMKKSLVSATGKMSILAQWTALYAAAIWFYNAFNIFTEKGWHEGFSIPANSHLVALLFIGLALIAYALVLLVYSINLFMLPLIASSTSTSLSAKIQQAFIILWYELPALIGGKACIALASLILVPLAFVGPFILSAITPNYYVLFLMALIIPLRAFFYGASLILAVLLYERFKNRYESILGEPF